MNWRLARLASSFSLLAACAAAASIHTDFEGARLERVENAGTNHFRVYVYGEKDQDGRNRQASWYAFRVDDARGEVVLDILGLPGEYNYKPNQGAITGDTPPVISYDRRNWKHVETFEYDAKIPRLRIQVRPTHRRFWIAHVPMYTNADLAKLRSRRSKAFWEEVIARSAEGRDLLLWTLHDGPVKRTMPVVWLFFRQHAWETGSSWTGEGLVRAVLDSPALRNSMVWKIFPISDPDGVAHGAVRFNRKGFDLNRNWDTADATRTPEISAQREAIAAWLRKGSRIDLAFSLHNTETSEYLEGPPGRFNELALRFYELLVRHSSFAPTRPLSYATEKMPPGRMNVVQGLFHDFGVPAFLMEQRIALQPKYGRLPLPEDRMRFGAELAKVIYALLQPEQAAGVFRE